MSDEEKTDVCSAKYRPASLTELLRQGLADDAAVDDAGCELCNVEDRELLKKVDDLQADEPDEAMLMTLENVQFDSAKIDYSKMQGYEVDAVKTYLKDIGRFRLLTGEEEVQIFRKMSNGDLKAKEIIINSNYRLVVNYAKKYNKQRIEFLDLIQAGNEGLIKAVNRFDYQKGYKFSTYATWWIRQSITRYIADHERLIRIPVHMIETLNKLKKVLVTCTANFGRQATIPEVATALDTTEERVEYLFQLLDDAVSLDIPVSEDGDSVLGDFVEQQSEKSPFDVVAADLLREQLNEVLNSLTPREKKVLELRFGFEDGRARTLEEVGHEFGVTRERIRQIEAKALRKLRHPSRSKKIKDYWG